MSPEIFSLWPVKWVDNLPTQRYLNPLPLMIPSLLLTLTIDGAGFTLCLTFYICNTCCLFQSTGIRCSERLCSFCYWRQSRTVWMQSCASCSRMALLEQGAWSSWPTVVPSNLSICVSVIPSWIVCRCPDSGLSCSSCHQHRYADSFQKRVKPIF